MDDFSAKQIESNLILCDNKKIRFVLGIRYFKLHAKKQSTLRERRALHEQENHLAEGLSMLSTDNYITKLFGMQGLILKNLESSENEVTFYMELERKEQPCPNCGVLTNCVHDYRTQKVKEVSVLGKLTTLVLRKRRYRCMDCGKRFLEQNKMLTKYSRMTNRLTKFICDRLENEYSFTSVAKEVDTSVNTIIRTFDKNSSYPTADIQDVVAIDEFKGNTGKEKYQCIVTDPKRRKVLDILPNRYGNQVEAYFKQNDDDTLSHVQYFISDMWKPYVDMASNCFANATKVIDKYHWIRQVIWAFESVRKTEQKKQNKKNRVKFKRSRILLNKRYQYLSAADQKRVDEMLELSEPLQKAYKVKESFFRVLDSKDSDQACLRLCSWISEAMNSEIDKFQECVSTIYTWKDGILNSFDCAYTNGFTEGCNNRIKVLKRNAYGYRNFNRFRNRILHMFTGSFNRRKEDEKKAA